MKQFKIYWLNKDEPEIIEGDDISDAFLRAGIGAWALNTIDYWEPIKYIEKENNV